MEVDEFYVGDDGVVVGYVVGLVGGDMDFLFEEVVEVIVGFFDGNVFVSGFIVFGLYVIENFVGEIVCLCVECVVMLGGGGMVDECFGE